MLTMYFGTNKHFLIPDSWGIVTRVCFDGQPHSDILCSDCSWGVMIRVCCDGHTRMSQHFRRTFEHWSINSVCIYNTNCSVVINVVGLSEQYSCTAVFNCCSYCFSWFYILQCCNAYNVLDVIDRYSDTVVAEDRTGRADIGRHLHRHAASLI